MNFDEENIKDDFFDGPDIPEPVKEPKKPVYQPDDPRYWEEPESEFEHLRPRRRWLLWTWVAGVGIAIGLIIAAYIRWFSPYVEEATEFGYVENIEREGVVFKTYEGAILPYKMLKDTMRRYESDFLFSTPDAKTAAKLRRMQYANRPVRVIYRKYHAAVPWRGATKVIIDSVDTVNPRNILPPEIQPEVP